MINYMHSSSKKIQRDQEKLALFQKDRFKKRKSVGNPLLLKEFSGIQNKLNEIQKENQQEMKKIRFKSPSIQSNSFPITKSKDSIQIMSKSPINHKESISKIIAPKHKPKKLFPPQKILNDNEEDDPIARAPVKMQLFTGNPPMNLVKDNFKGDSYASTNYSDKNSVLYRDLRKLSPFYDKMPVWFEKDVEKEYEKLNELMQKTIRAREKLLNIQLQYLDFQETKE